MDHIEQRPVEQRVHQRSATLKCRAKSQIGRSKGTAHARILAALPREEKGDTGPTAWSDTAMHDAFHHVAWGRLGDQYFCRRAKAARKRGGVVCAGGKPIRQM